MKYVLTLEEFLEEGLVGAEANLASAAASNTYKYGIMHQKGGSIGQRVMGKLGYKIGVHAIGNQVGKAGFNYVNNKVQKSHHPLLHQKESLNEMMKWGSGIKQLDVPDTIKHITETLSSALNVPKDDIITIGSAGKKKQEDLSYNINIAINKSSLLENNELDEKQTLEFLSYQLNELELENNLNEDILVVEWPVKGDVKNGNIEVQLQLSENLGWLKFSRYSPNLNEGESEYVGKYREVLLNAIVENTHKKILSYFDDNDVVKEYQTYKLNHNNGLEIITCSFAGKNGIQKKAIPIEESKRLVTNDPKEFTKLIFGESFSPDQLMSFEKIMECLKSNNFKSPKKVNKILSQLKGNLGEHNLTIPENLM